MVLSQYMDTEKVYLERNGREGETPVLICCPLCNKCYINRRVALFGITAQIRRYTPSKPKYIQYTDSE